MKPLLLAALGLLLLPINLWATSAHLSDGLPVPGEEQIRFSAHLVPQDLRPGEAARLVVQVDTEEGWHIYSVFEAPEEDAPPPTSVKITAPGLVPDGPVYETRPKTEFDKVIQMTLSSHEGQAFFYQNFRTGTDFEVGPRQLDLKIKFQTCSFRVCLPPKEIALSVPYRAVDAAPRDEYLTPDRSVDALPDLAAPQGSPLGAEGFWAFIGLAALMGLASLITPCVFPMVPITISYFSKQAEGNPAGLLKLASLFGLGIVGTYTGTGLILSWVFGAGAAVQLASNPWVNLAIAVLFVVFAASLMGAFEISLPAGIQGFFDQKARKTGGALGVVLMGFTFTLTAFTCTVQFVGTLMIAAAQGEWLWPLLGMLVFASVFAFPFFLLALAPALVGKMQGASGAWLGRAKTVLGLIELAASLKFFSNADLVFGTGLLSRDRVILAWMLLLVAILAYLIKTGLSSGRLKSPGQLTWILVFGGILFYTSQGLGGGSLGSLLDSVLPPPDGHSLVGAEYVSEEEAASLIWNDRFEAAMGQAQASGRPLFLEFTGYTCVNCRWMEQNILAQEPVHRLLKGHFTLARLYTDGGERGPANLDLQIERFKTVALPLYLILSPDGTERARFVGTARSGEEFEEFLAKGLKKK
ncbi:MAG: cytochrome c biogenesis protein CcdA [bacterium]|nr:cytochrome c biogenesis protein CcdA [bacterium]